MAALLSPRQAIRNQIRQRRRALSPIEQRQAAQQAADRLMALPIIQTAHSVAAFLSFDGELDTRPFIDALWQAKKAVYLPVLHPFSPGNLLFLRYTPETPLVVNRLKIAQPALDVRAVLPLGALDVLVTPLVAFDAQGQRLGMGGGFYDRTLQNWRHHGCYPIGLAHDCQWVPHIPSEAWDVPLPTLVTPSRVWHWEAYSSEMNPEGNS